MSSRSDLLSRFISRLAIFMAVLVTLLLPTGYFMHAHQDVSDDLTFKAQLKSSALKDLIASSPKTWMFAENRINGLISREPVILDTERVQVFDGSNQLLASEGLQPAGPLMVRRFPLFDSGMVVGYVTVTQSLHEIIIATCGVFLFGLMIGTLILFVLRRLPLRALDRLSDELFIEKERAGITLHSIGDAVISTDADLRILYVNPVA
jgi:PAS domain-containing protein